MLSNYFPPFRRMSLDEFIRLSERKLQHARRSTEDTTPGDVSDVSIASEASSMETSFMQAHHQVGEQEREI